MSIKKIFIETGGSYLIVEFSDSQLAKFSETKIIDGFKSNPRLSSVEPKADLIVKGHKPDQSYPEVNSVHFPDYYNGSYTLNLTTGINEEISAVEAKTLLEIVNGTI